MLKKYEAWLNEARGPRAALYQEDEIAIVENASLNIYGRWKSVYGHGLGRIHTIENKSGKWIYTLELLYGSFRTSGRDMSVYTKGELRTEQKNLTTEGAEDLMKILSAAKYKKGEAVSWKRGEIHSSGIIDYIETYATKNKKTVCYSVKTHDYKRVSVEEPEITEEITISKDTENFLAEEIAKLLNVEITNNTENFFEFSVVSYKLEDRVKGSVFFRTAKELDIFTRDLKEFIDSKLDPQLQSVMNEGKPSKVVVDTHTSYPGGRIKRNFIKDAAKNLKIDIREFLEKYKGKITGKKFGL